PWVGPCSERHLGFVTVPIAVPVGRDGAAAGVLSGYLDLRGLADELRPLAGDDLSLALVDADGAPMAVAGTAPADPRTEALPVGDAGWRVTAGCSEAGIVAEALAARDRARAWTLAGGALAVVLALGAAAFIRRPLGTLTRAARAMAAGELSTRARLRRR